MRSIIKVVICVTLVCVLQQGLLKAQSIWMSTKAGSMVSLEYQRPFYKFKFYGNDISTHTFTLAGRIKLQSGPALKFELPYTMTHIDEYKETFTFQIGTDTYLYTYSIPEVNSKTVGNLYIGVEFPTSENNSVDIGVRLPTTSKKEGVFTFTATSDYDRFEAYIPDYLSIVPMVNVNNDQSNPLALHLRFGPNIMIYTGSMEGVDRVDILLKASLQTGIQTEKFDFLFGYSGVFIVTESGDISNRIIHQAGFSAIGHFDNFHPGIYYRIPLDKNLKTVLNGVLGVSLGVEF